MKHYYLFFVFFSFHSISAMHKEWDPAKGEEVQTSICREKPPTTIESIVSNIKRQPSNLEILLHLAATVEEARQKKLTQSFEDEAIPLTKRVPC